MKHKKALSLTFGLALAIPIVFLSGQALAFDAEAAKTTARQNNCFRCHSVDKEKDGPTYRSVGNKYKDKDHAAAQTRLIEHITSGEKAKFPDGHEEEHKIINTKDVNEQKNLVDWILSLR